MNQMNIRHKFRNRYGDTQSFEEMENGNVFWHGCRQYERISVDDYGNVVMVDPSGGPYIDKGQDLGLTSAYFKGRVVDHFIMHDDGYEIVCE